MSVRARSTQCRCTLFTDEDKKTVDLQCWNKTRNKDGICDGCVKHRKEDETNTASVYKGRFGLARQATRKVGGS